uniref:Uncharacterized protein n=1 Tax=Oncorhynchus kisutch TaxID=8019 RepID=A0A8C7KN72_ONCKI
AKSRKGSLSRKTDSQPVLLADMSKASGRVDHADLLQHLASLCLCPGLLTWFHSCTTGRTQRVIANGMYSSWPEVTSGVPEVGVVSSYLFLLHMSTLRESSLRIHWTLAMPTTLEAKKLDLWMTENNMLLNGKKSVKLRICFSKNPPQPAPLILGGQAVPVLTCTKYLGFHLDNQLSGNQH